jgi:nitroimidazol reductase NimA-like FMN-containing flavoprotein (pyridoxamine 5'-phosphate oxidase superfamily)
MPRLTPSERAAFLTEPGVLMRIAVVRADGSPLVAPLWFIYEDESIYFTPRARSEWYGCLKRDPRVALSIDEQPLPYRKVGVEGRAELVYDLGADATWRDQYLRIAQRYVPPEAAAAYIRNTIDEPRALFRVPLARAKVLTWRMPVGNEPGDGIWHQRYYVSHDKSPQGGG